MDDIVPEADRQEQQQEVGPSGAGDELVPDIDLADNPEVPEADALEQAQGVPYDEEADRA
jgi:hypothetical protein